MEEVLDDETLLKLNILLNTHLNGLSLEEINLSMITAMKQQAGIHSSIVGNVIDAVADAIKADEDLEIYTSGANNIFKYPEHNSYSVPEPLPPALKDDPSYLLSLTGFLSVPPLPVLSPPSSDPHKDGSLYPTESFPQKYGVVKEFYIFFIIIFDGMC